MNIQTHYLNEELLNANDQLLSEVELRRKGEQRFRNLTLMLEQSNRSLEEFAAVVSHDLQAPLRQILFQADKIETRLAEVPAADTLERLERIRKSAFRMQELIDKLLEYSQVTLKEPEPEKVDLNWALSEALEDLESDLKRAGGKVHADRLPTIYGSPVQMRQLFQNLIGNSVKFRKKDEPPVIQIVACQPSAGLWEIRIRDNGIGMEQEQAERIFQPFQQLHGRSEYGGVGMGLAICMRIVEHQGGTLSVKSAPGQGATFFITLPENLPA